MQAKERILTIQLINKLKAHPQYAQTLGIQIQADRLRSRRRKTAEPAKSLPFQGL